MKLVFALRIEMKSNAKIKNIAPFIFAIVIFLIQFKKINKKGTWFIITRLIFEWKIM